MAHAANSMLHSTIRGGCMRSGLDEAGKGKDWLTLTSPLASL